MRTLRDMNTAKFAAEDAPLFAGLVDDLFPGTSADAAPAADVAAALAAAARERGLQPHAPWIEKGMQLYDTSLVRHGIMLVGPSGSGKTAVVECLAAALTSLGRKTVVWRLNPKALTAPQMFGRMDAATGDWTDGVFAALWRRAAKAASSSGGGGASSSSSSSSSSSASASAASASSKDSISSSSSFSSSSSSSTATSVWIVLDGPVDAIWIENLNTVLDDNRVLTLANGDRVPMASHMKLLFEVEHLANASPATVSRAGIIYLSGSELGWRPLVSSWLASKRPAEAAALAPLFERVVPAALAWLRGEGFEFGSGGGGSGSAGAASSSSSSSSFLSFPAPSPAPSPAIKITDVHATATLLRLLDGALATMFRGGGVSDAAAAVPNDDLSSSSSSSFSGACSRLFFFCAAWGLGGALDSGDRARFHKLLALLSSAPLGLPASESENAAAAVAAGGSGDNGGDDDGNSSTLTLFDVALLDRASGWKPWTSCVPAFKYPTSDPMPDFASLSVPTAEAARLEALLSLVHAAGGASLLVGAPGTAKTSAAQRFLCSRPKNESVTKTLTFSSLTTPAIVQASVEACFSKRQGRSYGPPAGRVLTLLFDDLGAPALNEWGDQVASEAVRQLLEVGGMYSLEKPIGDMRSIVDTRYE